MAVKFQGGKARQIPINGPEAQLFFKLSPHASKSENVLQQMRRLQQDWMEISKLVPDKNNALRMRVGLDLQASIKAFELAHAEFKELSAAVWK